jgi:ABC-type glycerol-3-phosphate transport system substrate-binding protein
MKKRTIAPLLLLVVLAALVVAGCGGGSSSGSSSSGSTESTEGSGGEGSTSFASGADAACTAANKKIEALGTPQQEEVLEYLESTEEVIAELDQKIQGLVGSGSAEAAYATALGKSLPIINEMTNAARNENFDAVRELSDELVELNLGELAEAAELKTCAVVPVEES